VVDSGIPLVNKKVPGLVKDENNGAIMAKFVGLRANMYALRVNGKKDTKKVKDVKNNVVAKSITFNNTRCLFNEIEMTRKQSCIRSGDTVVSQMSSISSDIERYTTPEKLSCIFTRAGEM